MKRRFIRLFFGALFVVIAGGFVSCSKDVMEEEEVVQAAVDSGEQPSTKGNGTLIVRTKAADDDNGAVVSYPVHVYVFSENDVCVEMTTIESSENPINMKLSEGIYTVCAIAGASTDDYEVPAKENAAKASVVQLKSDKAHDDLMYAQCAIVLSEDEVNTLTLSMERKVMLLQDVTISNIPSDVTAVSVTIAPLYDGLRLDGLYNGMNGSHTVSLVRQGDTGVWKTDDSTYLLEAVAGATVKVQITASEETKGYSYTLNGELQANYKIRINGTYAGHDGVVLTGTITGAVWAGERVVTFDFDENGSGSGSGGSQTTTDDVPEVGTMYKGCYVMNVVPQAENITKVTLMAPTQAFGLSFTEGDNASVRAAIDTKIKELAVDGIRGWRLPTESEVVEMFAKRKEINSALEDAGIKNNNIIPGVSYFYETSDGNIDAYCEIGEPEFGTATRLRAFTTLIFSSVR